MIWLVRHGESLLNMAGVRHGWDDTYLTRLGREQAEQAGAELMGVAAPVVISSPLLRAKETAAIICRTIGLTMPDGDPTYGCVDELIERPYEGEWLESCEHAGQRARRIFDQWSPEANVIAVTHAGIIKGLTGSEQTPPNGSVTQWSPSLSLS